ncbi:hypothetical protein PPERSA_06929 [Pseudocohnilembus persalinus]|uniref:Uncharacterized protein n=1 Tax=Pseudocohnilembus persalinus TaxID=266149 RepID=A0A0V0QYI4_PSEPJ|nr:hypothetical protein PPERSA_06929 [Pseudocohnilembus persalinus]|eukprot:KRX07314.1 hypothetical protein PPERSA_06929 [Pseudocohnilembus persalinus]
MGSCVSKNNNLNQKQVQQKNRERGINYIEYDKEKQNDTKAAESDNHNENKQNVSKNQLQNLEISEQNQPQLQEKGQNLQLEQKQFPIQISTGESNIEEIWGQIIQKNVIDYLVEIFLKEKNVNDYNIEIQKIIEALKFKNNEQKMIIIQKVEQQLQTYIQGIYHTTENYIKEINEDFQKLIHPYIHFLYLNSEEQRQCYNDIIETVLNYVQRQFKKNLPPIHIGNEYLTGLYDNVLGIVEEMVPQDEPKNPIYKILAYQKPNFKLVNLRLKHQQQETQF